jgi:DNA-binding response OmpR family regulator
VGGGAGKTVLVADDDEALRLLCRVNLELDGYRVVEAASLREARELLAAEPVDAILLDVHLADGDGRELLRELGPTRPRTALFTGSAQTDDVGKIADTAIRKPFELDELRSTVAWLVAGAPPDR